MSLTRVTSTVVSSNAITSAKLSNNIIEARHIKDQSVGLAASLVQLILRLLRLDLMQI